MFELRFIYSISKGQTVTVDRYSHLFLSIPHSFTHSVVSYQHYKKVPRRGSSRRMFLYYAGVLLAKSSYVNTDRDEREMQKRLKKIRMGGKVELMMSAHKTT